MHRLHVCHVPDSGGDNDYGDESVEEDYILICEASNRVSFIDNEDAYHERCACDVFVVIQDRLLLEKSKNDSDDHEDTIGKHAFDLQC